MPLSRMALAALARRFSIPALLALLPMAASYYAPLDAWHPHAQRALVLAAGAAAAVFAVWSLAGSHDAAQSVLAMNTLFGRQLEAVKRRPSTPPSSGDGDDGERELRDLPPREPAPHVPNSHRWHLLPRAEQPELSPASRKYIQRVSERLRRAAAQHGLSLTAAAGSSLALHAHPPGGAGAATPGPRIALRLGDGALLVALHEADAAEARAKGWAHAVSHRFVRDRHEVELLRPPADDAELAVVLEIVDAGVKYLRSRAAELLCNEILDLVF